MPVGTGFDIKSGVIYEWLAGTPRDKIAEIYNISTGGVTNIINEWRMNLGSYIAEDLRELSLSLKKTKMTPIQCSMGFRVAKIMQRLGITEDQFESFMSDIYSRCQKLEIGPDQMERYLAETINLSKIVFPSQIPNYVNTKKNDIAKLQEQIESLQQEISRSNIKKSSIERDLNLLIDESNISREAVAWYKNFKQEFENAQIPINDISLFSHCLSIFKSQGYDVGEILRKIAEYKDIDDLNDFHQITIDIHQKNLENLINQERNLRAQINSHQLKIFKMQQLESMGFGLQEFKILYNKIIEIGTEHDIYYEIAIKNFLNDLDDYDDMLGFKSKVEILKKEFSNLNSEISNQRSIISSQQYIGSTLQSLLKMGMSENDILEINSILSSYESHNYNVNKNTLNKQSLIKDLTIYRDIKLAIREYKIKKDKLFSKITELENQKLNLQYYLYLLIMLVYRFRDLQLLMKKADVALENPKVIFFYMYVFYNQLNNADKDIPEENDNDDNSSTNQKL
jgi:hypothetical protein